MQGVNPPLRTHTVILPLSDIEVTRNHADARVLKLVHAAHVLQLRATLVPFLLATTRLGVHIRDSPIPSPHSKHMPPVGGSGECITSGRVGLGLGSGTHGSDVEVFLRAIATVICLPRRQALPQSCVHLVDHLLQQQDIRLQRQHLLEYGLHPLRGACVVVAQAIHVHRDKA